MRDLHACAPSVHAEIKADALTFLRATWGWSEWRMEGRRVLQATCLACGGGVSFEVDGVVSDEPAVQLQTGRIA